MNQEIINDTENKSKESITMSPKHSHRKKTIIFLVIGSSILCVIITLSFIFYFKSEESNEKDSKKNTTNYQDVDLNSSQKTFPTDWVLFTHIFIPRPCHHNYLYQKDFLIQNLYRFQNKNSAKIW